MREYVTLVEKAGYRKNDMLYVKLIVKLFLLLKSKMKKMKGQYFALCHSVSI